MSTLEEMKSVDVRTVDRDSLVDINEIRIVAGGNLILCQSIFAI